MSHLIDINNNNSNIEAMKNECICAQILNRPSTNIFCTVCGFCFKVS